VVEEIEIWRAAKQIIKQYPDDPVLAAAQRADAAYEAGDLFNFDLWTRITRATATMMQEKPCGGEALN